MNKSTQDIREEAAQIPQTSFVRATVLKRLTNLVVDILAFYFIILTFNYLFGSIFTGTSDDEYFSVSAVSAHNDSGEEGFSLSRNLLWISGYILYISILEISTKGKSIGKMVTGTRAVKEDGSVMDPLTAFARGVIRFIPFEFVSYFGHPCNPWHDQWTQTMVIDETPEEQTDSMQSPA